MTPSDELSRLFAAERAVRAPSSSAERGLERLLADVAMNVAPLSLDVGSLKLGSWALSKWILAGFAVGVAGSGVAARAWAPPDNAQLAPAALSAPIVERVAPAPRAEAVPEPSTAPVAPRAVGQRPAAASASAATSETFDAELRLVTLAKGEIDAGRPHLAKAWLAEHARRFRAGVFASDRDALRVLASCAERRDPSLAEAFVARHPTSPLGERLLRACSSNQVAPFLNESPPAGEPTRR